MQPKLKAFNIASQILDLAVQNTFTKSIYTGIKVYEWAQLALLFIDAAVRTASKRVTISWWQWYPKEEEEFHNHKEEVNPTDSEYQSTNLEVNDYRLSVSSIQQRRLFLLRKRKELLIETYSSSEEAGYAFIYSAVYCLLL